MEKSERGRGKRSTRVADREEVAGTQRRAARAHKHKWYRRLGIALVLVFVFLSCFLSLSLSFSSLHRLLPPSSSQSCSVFHFAQTDLSIFLGDENSRMSPLKVDTNGYIRVKAGIAKRG